MSLPDINAGAWYLQARPDGWWDVCEPTTGEPLAEVTADQQTGELTVRGDATAGEAVEPAETPQVHNGADQDHETMVGIDPEEGS